jgi:hypothetical protein
MSKRNRNGDARGRGIAGALSLYGSDSKHVKTVTVEDDQPRETLASFTKKYNEDAEAARVAPIRAAERELNENLRALREENRKALLLIPSADLAKLIGPPWCGTEEELLASAQFAFARFKEQLLREGITFTPAAGNKLAQIAKLNPYLDWTNAIAVRQIFDYCFDLGLWDGAEVISSEAASKTPAPTPEPVDTGLTLDKIEGLDTRTSDAQRASESAVNQYFYSREVGPIWESWKAHMVRDYRFVPNDKQGRAIIDWFVKNNKSFLDTRNWDKCRVALREVLGNSPRTGQPMLTRDELLSISLDSDQIDLDSREGKRQFLKKSQELREMSDSEIRAQEDEQDTKTRIKQAEEQRARAEGAKLIDEVLKYTLTHDAAEIRRRVMQSDK